MYAETPASLHRYLRDVALMQRVRWVPQEFLLGIQLHAPQVLERVFGPTPPQYLEIVSYVLEQLQRLLECYRTEASAGTPPVSLPRWAAEVRAGATGAIYRVRHSALHTFVRTLQGPGESSLRDTTQAAVGALSLLPLPVLAAIAKGKAPPTESVYSSRDLLERAQRRADAARRTLVHSYLGYGLRLAHGYVGYGLPYPDLVQEASDGLLEATARFDPWLHRYKQHATTWCWQRVTKAIQDYGTTVRLPFNRLRGLFAFESGLEALVDAGVTEPGHPDLLDAAAGRNGSDRLNIDTVRLLVATRTLQPMEVLVRMVDDTHETPGDALMQESLHIDIERALSMLHEREAEILRLYYGLGGCVAMTLEEIGQRYGLTRERVRQLREKALRRLRQKHRREELQTYIG